jgi:hypothetical protein
MIRDHAVHRVWTTDPRTSLPEVRRPPAAGEAAQLAWRCLRRKRVAALETGPDGMARFRTRNLASDGATTGPPGGYPGRWRDGGGGHHL